MSEYVLIQTVTFVLSISNLSFTVHALIKARQKPVSQAASQTSQNIGCVVQSSLSLPSGELGVSFYPCHEEPGEGL